MAKSNPVRDKAYVLAVNIVFFCRKTMHEQKEYVLTKQLLRSGTSIGANIEEAQEAQSRKDFRNKCSIALKEAYETRYWLKLMNDCKIGNPKQIQSLLTNINDVIRLLVSIIKTTKTN